MSDYMNRTEEVRELMKPEVIMNATRIRPPRAMYHVNETFAIDLVPMIRRAIKAIDNEHPMTAKKELGRLLAIVTAHGLDLGDAVAHELFVEQQHRGNMAIVNSLCRHPEVAGVDVSKVERRTVLEAELIVQVEQSISAESDKPQCPGSNRYWDEEDNAIYDIAQMNNKEPETGKETDK